VVYGGVCMVVCDRQPGRGGAREPPTARAVRFGDPVYSCMVRGGLYLKVVYEFRVDVFLLRHVLTFFIEYDVVLKEVAF
jgi:hypothetical protein